jgi:FtsP/CotA-like multicopper oxidase with cupredoxin domain
MRPLALKKTKALVVLVAMTAVYAVTAVSPAAAANITIGLCATTGTVALPGTGNVPIWGFVRSDTAVAPVTGDTTTGSAVIATVSSTAGLAAGQSIAGSGLPVGTTIVSVDTTLSTVTVSNNATATATGVTFTIASGCSGTAQLPSPTLEVNLGDVVTINVTSALAGASPASFEVPGLDVRNPQPGTYTFNAGRVGTFAYQSPGDAGRQIAMGLSGALVVRPASEPAGFGAGTCSTAAGLAYGTAFARECLLVMSAIDPDFNVAPLTFDLNDYEATYWLLNGTVYPNTPAIVAPQGSALLLRYVNTGYDNTAMSLLGLHEHVLARGAFSMGANQFDAATEIIPAGATEDALITMPAYAAPGVNGFPLFNRNLHLQNGAGASAIGGMLVFIHS